MSEKHVAPQKISRGRPSADDARGPDDTADTASPGGGGRIGLIFLLAALVALGPLTIDLYLPALPAITGDLSASPTLIQLTLTGMLIGMAAGQLVIGPLSDTLGRRRPLLAGVILHVAASVVSAFAPTVAILIAARVVQGVGAAAGAVIAMAVVRDLYSGRPAAAMLSRLLLVMGVAPVIAPTLGGQLLRFVSWRGVLGVLAVCSVVLLPVVFWVLRETLPAERRRAAGLGPALRAYRGLLLDRVFIGLVLVGGLTFSVMFAYISGSSFVFQEQFGLDGQQFGLLFGGGALFLMAAQETNARLLRRFEPRNLLVVALGAIVVAATVMLVMAATHTGGVAGIVAPLWGLLAALGFAMPNTPVLALHRHGAAAGTASALLGAANFGVGAIVTPIVGVLGGDALAMSVAMTAVAVLALLILLIVVRPSHLDDLDSPAR